MKFTTLLNSVLEAVRSELRGARVEHELNSTSSVFFSGKVSLCREIETRDENDVLSSLRLHKNNQSDK